MIKQELLEEGGLSFQALDDFVQIDLHAGERRLFCSRFATCQEIGSQRESGKVSVSG
jgi:hypothetical protein